ncbi:hypothetical protein ISS85_01535 [Candidatus Microgenomates bacterium]|nr:hypothetical protein [Candidatus Microgenomates bacterium]
MKYKIFSHFKDSRIQNIKIKDSHFPHQKFMYKQRGQIVTVLTLIALGVMSLGALLASRAVKITPSSPFYIGATECPSCPSAPQVTAVDNGDSTCNIALNWNDVDDEEWYQIWKNGSHLTTTGPNITSWEEAPPHWPPVPCRAEPYVYDVRPEKAGCTIPDCPNGQVSCPCEAITSTPTPTPTPSLTGTPPATGTPTATPTVTSTPVPATPTPQTGDRSDFEFMGIPSRIPVCEETTINAKIRNSRNMPELGDPQTATNVRLWLTPKDYFNHPETIGEVDPDFIAGMPYLKWFDIELTFKPNLFAYPEDHQWGPGDEKEVYLWADGAFAQSHHTRLLFTIFCPAPTSTPTPTPTGTITPQCPFKAKAQVQDASGNSIDGTGFSTSGTIPGTGNFDNNGETPLFYNDNLSGSFIRNDASATLNLLDNWTIVDTFCSLSKCIEGFDCSASPPSCPTNAGAVAALTGFNVDCGAEYVYGWKLTGPTFTPTPTPTTTPVVTATPTVTTAPPTPTSTGAPPPGGKTYQYDWHMGDHQGKCWVAWADSSCGLSSHEGGIQGAGYSCSGGDGSDHNTTITNNSGSAKTYYCDKYECNSCSSSTVNPQFAECRQGQTAVGSATTVNNGCSATCGPSGITTSCAPPGATSTISGNVTVNNSGGVEFDEIPVVVTDPDDENDRKGNQYLGTSGGPFSITSDTIHEGETYQVRSGAWLNDTGRYITVDRKYVTAPASGVQITLNIPEATPGAGECKDTAGRAQTCPRVYGEACNQNAWPCKSKEVHLECSSSGDADDPCQYYCTLANGTWEGVTCEDRAEICFNDDPGIPGCDDGSPPLGVPARSVTATMVDQACNGDGAVTAADYYFIIKNAYQSTENCGTLGDVNRDCLTNGLDVSIAILRTGEGVGY